MIAKHEILYFLLFIQGDLLISSAVTSKTMYIWNYPLETCVPLRSISSDTLNFVHWSPDNTKVFSCSTNETFR